MLCAQRAGLLAVYLHVASGAKEHAPCPTAGLLKEGTGHSASFRWVSDVADTRWHSRMRMCAPHGEPWTSSAALLQTPGLTSLNDMYLMDFFCVAYRRWSLRMLMCGLCALPWTSSAGRWRAGRDQAMSSYGTLRTLRPSLLPSSDGTLESRLLWAAVNSESYHMHAYCPERLV